MASDSKSEDKAFYLDSDNSNIIGLKANGYIEPAKNNEGLILKNMYQFTDKYNQNFKASTQALHTVTGMTVEHIQECLETAIANNTIIGMRPVNIDARDLLSAGAMGKPLATKGKSSIGGRGSNGTSDPTKGFIPFDQSLSKLDSQKDIEKFQHKVEDAIKNGESEKFQLIQTNPDGDKIKWSYKSNKNGSKEFIYNKDGNEKDFFYKDDSGKEQVYSGSVDNINPLEVLGETLNGKAKFYTADYDPLFYSVKISQNLESQAPLPDDHYEKLESSNKEIPSKRNSIIHTKGNVSKEQEVLSSALKEATGGATSHGADTSNPVSFKEELHGDLKQGVSMFKPNGEIVIIKNNDPIIAEKELVNFINKSREEGYLISPNPRWGWEQDKDGKFTVPEQRLDWKKLAENIDKLQETADKAKVNIDKKQKQASTAKEIYNLQTAISEYQYREPIFHDKSPGTDLENRYKNNEKDAIYITSSNYEQAKEKMADLETSYKKEFRRPSPLKMAAIDKTPYVELDTIDKIPQAKQQAQKSNLVDNMRRRFSETQISSNSSLPTKRSEIGKAL